MISDSALQKIETLASEVAQREGVKIYDIEFSGGAQGRALRVFIDKEGGASVDDCANVSRGLNLLLDVEDPVPGGHYNLEVSTPGLERHLKKDWHFSEAVGKTIWVRLKRSLESVGVTHPRYKSAKQIQQVLQTFEDGQLKFQLEDVQVVLPLTHVEKARVVFDFNEGKQEKNPLQKKKKGSKK